MIYLLLLYNLFSYFLSKFDIYWKCAGPVFGFGQNPIHQRWSGSACVNSGGTVHLYYPDVDTATDHNDQKFATIMFMLADNNRQISIVDRQNEKILFAGDGKLYQTFDQFEQSNMNVDNFCLRDPHIFVDNGKCYLVFEGSTGSDTRYGSNLQPW